MVNPFWLTKNVYLGGCAGFLSPTPPEGTGHDRATTAPRKPKLILMTAPVSCPPRGNRRVARSGAEWRGDLLFPQGWGVVQKMYFVWAEAPEFCRPFPLVGGVVQKSVFGGGVAPDFVAPYLQGWGSSIKCIFGGGTRYSASNPPRKWGSCPNKCIGGGGCAGF